MIRKLGSVKKQRQKETKQNKTKQLGSIFSIWCILLKLWELSLQKY